LVSDKTSAQQICCFDWCLNPAPASQYHITIGTSSGSVYLAKYVVVRRVPCDVCRPCLCCARVAAWRGRSCECGV
jgi:hypothetical protein